jgi:type I restriction enzyme S subunit
MGLCKYTLGELVELASIKCGIPQCETVSGINIFKRFMPSRNVGIDTSNYLVVPYGHFAFNLMHVGRDEKIPVAMNGTNEKVIVSSAYFVFKVIDERKLLKEYLYMIMSSPEFDRYAWFCTDSSVRGNIDWDRFCEIEINLPPLPIQQKYVDVYNAMFANQRAYEKGLEDLKLTCDAYIEKLRKEIPLTAIGEYIEPCEEQNTSLEYAVDSVKGVSIEKRFIETKADMGGVSLKPYLLVEPDAFAYVTVTSRNGEKISLAHNDSTETFICSSSYVVFRVRKKDKLIPRYLRIFFSHSEFDRYTRFHSWGSARETFGWNDMCEVKIPIPDIGIQQSIVNIYNAYTTRRGISEKLKLQLKKLCPILIKGAVEEVQV